VAVETWRSATSAPDYDKWQAGLRREKSERTATDYGRTVRDLLTAYPGKKVADFTTEACQKLLDGYPPASRQARKAALVSFFRGPYTRNEIPANPADRLQVPTPRKRPTPEVFTEAEVARLCALEAPDGPLFVLMFECGLRKRDCLNLRRRDAHVERAYLVVTSGEGHVPLTAAAQQAVDDLDASVGLSPNDHLWSSNPGGGTVIRRNKPIANTTFQTWYRECLKRARVRHREARTTHRTFEHRAKLQEEATRVSAAEVQADVATLGRLVAKVCDEDVRGYLDEAVICLQHGSLRAAVVFVWSGAVRTLQDAALAKGETALNAALQKQDSRVRTVRTVDDFGWVKDRTFLDALPDLGILDKGQKTTLVGALDLRNNCGHPTKYRPGVKKVSAYIEDVVSVVFP
jgi:integrase